MRRVLKQLRSVVMLIFAVIGALFVLAALFIPRSQPSAAQPSLAIIAATFAPTQQSAATLPPAADASPTDTPTPLPLPTITPIRVTAKTNALANLREGPGTDFAIAGTAEPGTELTITGSNSTGDWYVTQQRDWIAAFLLESLPIVPTTTPTNTPNATTITWRATTETKRASATSTAEARAYVPPEGTWCEVNTTRGVCVGDFRYTNSIGYSNASSSARFIAFYVIVQAGKSSSISANPNDLTLVMDDGSTYAYDAETFSYWDMPFEHTEIGAGDNMHAGIVFYVPNNQAPKRVIYRGGLWETEIVIDLTKPPSEK